MKRIKSYYVPDTFWRRRKGYSVMKSTANPTTIIASQDRLASNLGSGLSREENFNGIDLTKFVFSFLICLIHIDPFNLDNHVLKTINFWLQTYLCRIAVPYYFMVASFLLFRKMKPDQLDFDRISNYCMKILRLLGTWTILLFVGGVGHLWFLSALVVSVILISLLYKASISPKLIATVVFFLYLIGLLGDSYYGLFRSVFGFSFIGKLTACYKILFSSTRNGFFFGAVFVFLGTIFAFYKLAIRRTVAAIGFVFSMVALAVEVYLLNHYSLPIDHNMYIFLLPTLFFLANLTFYAHLKNRPIYKRLRIVGMLVFYLHLFMNYFVGYIIHVVDRTLGIDLGTFQFLITISFTLLVAIVIERLSVSSKLRWLKYLYS